jgi:hypothetical protein
MSNVERVFDQYIKGTPKKAIVRDLTIKFCTLTKEVQRVCDFPTMGVHVTTRVLKKNYDKRPHEENDFLLKKGWKIVYTPDAIYKNKDGKRGDYLFAKTINNSVYVASIEVSTYADTPILYIASIYRVPKPKSYLNGYELIWSWKGGDPSS